MPNNIFLNYRREDSSGYSLAIYNELIRVYDKSWVFKDFSTIEPGEDFEESINNALNSCTILLVIIGDNWLQILKKREQLQDEPDFVRIEIASALSKGIYTIPIAINGAKKPRHDELPEDLKNLTKRQYLDLDQTRFETDIHKLISVIDKRLNINRANSNSNDSTKTILDSANAPKVGQNKIKAELSVIPKTVRLFDKENKPWSIFTITFLCITIFISFLIFNGYSYHKSSWLYYFNFFDFILFMTLSSIIFSFIKPIAPKRVFLYLGLLYLLNLFIVFGYTGDSSARYILFPIVGMSLSYLICRAKTK